MAPPGYLLVLGHSLNGEKMTRYSATLPPIYEKYGGFYLGIGAPARGVEHLEGPWFDHSLVLARFKSPDDITNSGSHRNTKTPRNFARMAGSSTCSN
jgi:uncharacterized protein (DUF1330 family)